MKTHLCDGYGVLFTPKTTLGIVVIQKMDRATESINYLQTFVYNLNTARKSVSMRKKTIDPRAFRHNIYVKNS